MKEFREEWRSSTEENSGALGFPQRMKLKISKEIIQSFLVGTGLVESTKKLFLTITKMAVKILFMRVLMLTSTHLHHLVCFCLFA